MMRQFMNAADDGDTYIRPSFMRYGGTKANTGGTDLKENFKFESHNELDNGLSFYLSFDSLGFNGVIGENVDLVAIPDFGYNNEYEVDWDRDMGSMQGTGAVKITRLPRKMKAYQPPQDDGHQTEGADMTLTFRDNARGMRDSCGRGTNQGYTNYDDSGFSYGSVWSYGFELHMYYSDYEYNERKDKWINRDDDNMRVMMVEMVNERAKVENPLADQVGSEFTEALFDLPNWIEAIPIVGWALENLVNWFIGLFWDNTRRLRGLPTAADQSDSDEGWIQRSMEFEFLATDDTLDCFNIPESPYPGIIGPHGPGGLRRSRFPQFSEALNSPRKFTPPVYLLADMTGREATDAIKTEYDNFQTKIYKEIAKEIGNNEHGFRYGADYDFLTKTDLVYGLEQDGSFVPYGAYSVGSGDDARGLMNSDGILGMSFDQYVNGENARVIYLNPAKFGGSYLNPPLYVKPINYTGWFGFINVFFPTPTACKPHNSDLIDFDEIKAFIEKIYPEMPEDPRLAQDLECIREVPFRRIMDRGGRVGMYSLILAAIRIYASTHLFKAVGTFSKIAPWFPQNYSTVYAAYIVERMEEDFKSVQGAFWETFNTFKDDEFWYGFLEQSVECYNFLVEQGEIEQPTQKGHLQQAFDRINDLQTDYAFPYLMTDKRRYKNSEGNRVTQTVPGLLAAKAMGDAGFFQTLKGYRESKNMEAVQLVEEEAKLILMQLVNREFTKIGEKMVRNMRATGFNPTIFDLDFWIFQNKCQCPDLKFLGPRVIEVPVGLPEYGGPDGNDGHYTSGGEFRVFSDEDATGGASYAEEYRGYYHLETDEEGFTVYVAGETMNEKPQDILTPVDSLIGIKTVELTWQENSGVNADAANSSIIPRGTNAFDTQEDLPAVYPQILETPTDMGDVPDISDTPDASGGEDAHPFALRKYISITKNGTTRKYSQEEAKSVIMLNEESRLLSEVYPGSIQRKFNDNGELIGYEGHMGVRYGLNFYYCKNGTNHLITSVEVDALDLPIGQFRTLQPNSKLLHCLLVNLKHDPKYQLMTKYIFSYRKATAMLAMYNDIGFLSSVGEVTPGEGDETYPVATSGLLRAVLDLFDGINADPDVRSDWLGRRSDGKGTASGGESFGELDASGGFHPGIECKPGSRAYIDRTSFTRTYKKVDVPSPWWTFKWLFPSDDDIEVKYVQTDMRQSGVTGNEGWSHHYDRQTHWWQPATWGVEEWDKWDRILLRNSRSRIKTLFRTYYNSRSYRPGDNLLGRGKNPVSIFIKNLKASLMPSPAKGLLPWHKKGKVRSNPFNAKGEMCDENN